MLINSISTEIITTELDLALKYLTPLLDERLPK